MGRRMLAISLLACVAAAGEPDGAIAEAARWVGPTGCASGSFRSRARPVVTEIEEAWRLDLRRIEAAPVHWDGRGYVVARKGMKAVLIAFDLDTGRVLARKTLKSYVTGSGLFVWDHVVLLQPTPTQINGYRLEGGSFEMVWIFRGRKYQDGWRHPRLPVVHDNEVYCFLGNGLARLRPGARFPSWVLDSRQDRVDPRYAGRPAVYGPFVFVAAMNVSVRELMGKETITGATLRVSVHRRSDGRRVHSFRVCSASPILATKPPNLRVTVDQGHLHIASDWPLPTTSKGSAYNAVVPLEITADTVQVTKAAGLTTYKTPPALHGRGAVILVGSAGPLVTRRDPDLEWLWWLRDGKYYVLTSHATQPDLFADRVTPTVLGDIVYFGTWAMDLETHEILWRLPFPEVSFSVVPADGRFLAVEDFKVLHCFRGRGRR